MSTFYPKFKEKLWQAQLDISTVVVRAVLIDTGVYTYNAAHDAYDDLTGIVGTETDPITAKTFTDGLFDGGDVTAPLVSGNTVEAIVLFVDSGTPATDYLIAYIDSGNGLPFTPNGQDIPITWNPSGIAQL